jgi:hypothetical protein
VGTKITLSSPSTGIGFFPGLSEPRTLDLDSLPTPMADALHQAVAALFASPPPGSPADRDAVIHRVTIEEGASTRSIEAPPIGTMGEVVRQFRSALRNP